MGMLVKRKANGFTIVELVIIIAVIAILAAVLIPTFSNIINKANEAACLEEAKSKFNELYAIDYADGTIDGQENGVLFVDPETNKITSMSGFENCLYDISSQIFTYKNEKYKCSTTFSLSNGNNTWEIESIDE